MQFLLQTADVFFIVFHTTLILFNVFGWMIPRLRKLNLITLSLTAFSWFILGIIYGWGYCVFTDWHWQVMRKLGKTPTHDSYIGFLIDKITGISIDGHIVETWTLIIFLLSVIASVTLNVRDAKRR